MNIHRLTVNQIEEYREYLWNHQNHICPLCRTEMTLDEAVLDHDHNTGHIRAALHRSCNQSEGVILQFASNRCRSEDPEQFIRSLVEYWNNDYSMNPLHPSHYLPEEKERLELKRKVKHLVRPSAVERTKARIAELNAIIKTIVMKVGSPDEWYKE